MWKQAVARACDAVGVERRTATLLVALAAIWLGFDAATGGLFLSPRNLYSLAVQSSVVGIMSVAMVLVIVSRHIDLSVGSVLGVCGMVAAVLAVETFPPEAPWTLPLTAACVLVLGALIGAAQGWLVAWRGIPSFVVTLAGLLVFRGAAFEITSGRTVAPFSETYQLMGGGLHGALGPQASLIAGGVAILVSLALLLPQLRRRGLVGVLPRAALMVAGIAAFVLVMNAAPNPVTHHGRGLPLPVLILLAVVVGGEVLARQTRFGRYVFAIGGSPEAAILAGIPVRRVLLWVFALSGALAALAALVTTARLNAGTNALGSLAELNVIAAAVVGGTSLSGGRGTIVGAVIGAVLIQSLETGLVLVGSTSSQRQIVIGLMLVFAVWLDSLMGGAGSRAAA